MENYEIIEKTGKVINNDEKEADKNIKIRNLYEGNWENMDGWWTLFKERKQTQLDSLMQMYAYLEILKTIKFCIFNIGREIRHTSHPQSTKRIHE